jgi:hypothetical protein
VEVPSVRLARLGAELEQIEAELLELEKSDRPLHFQEASESRQQLNEIECLRLQIAEVVQSDAFRKLEAKTVFDEVLEEYQEERIKAGVDALLAHSVKAFAPAQASAAPEGGGEIELFVAAPTATGDTD